MKKLLSLCLALLLLVAGAGAARADFGAVLDNQMPPSEAVVRQMAAAAEQFTFPGGDVAKARPDLLLLVEANAASDFADFIIPVFQDRTTYDGIVDTLEEAYAKADAKTKSFILFNLVRVHEIRAHGQPVGTARKPYVEAARKTAARFDKTFQDPGLWAVKGDIEADAGNVDAAAAAYKKMGITGSGTPAMAQYKMAQAYQSAGRYTEAETAYKNGVRAEASTPDAGSGGHYMRHNLYQGLVSLYLQKGDFAQAATALTESVRGIKPQPSPPILLRHGAEELLRRSTYAKAVLDYANAALLLNPADTDMVALRDKAALAVQSQTPTRPR